MHIHMLMHIYEYIHTSKNNFFLRYIYPHPYSFPRSGLTGSQGLGYGGAYAQGGTQSGGGAAASGCNGNGNAGSSMTGGAAYNGGSVLNFGNGTMKYYCVLCIFSYFFYLQCVLNKIIFLRINIFHVCILIGIYSNGNHFYGGFFFIIFFLNRFSVFLKVYPY